MGGSNSTRRITVVNDDSTGVIKISDSVVYRLKGELDEKHGSPTKAKPSPTPSPPSQLAAPEAPPPKALPEVAPPPAPPAPCSPKKGPPSAGEEYWRQKYQEGQRHADLLHRETTKEFQRGLQEVESLFSPPSKTQVCEEFESKVLQCYLANPKTSLNCSHQVKAFSDCVDAMRSHALASKG